MKFSLLLLCLFPISVFAQKAAVFELDSLPRQGILLDKGWKWCAGDNPDFAKVDFDDVLWQSIDPNKELSELPEVFDPKIKWLRFDFEITNKLHTPLGLTVNQAGASELYLNGRLFHRYGHFDTDPSKVVAYDPKEVAIHIPADTIGHYTLAVRYCLQPNIRYTNTYALTQNRLFHAHFVDLVPTLHAQRKFHLYFSGMDIFIIGVAFLLAILHLSLYLYNKDNKTQLILAIYLIGVVVIRVLKLIGQNQHSVENRYFTLNFSNLALGLVMICLTDVIYRMAKIRLDIFYKIIIGYQAVYVIVAFFSYGYPWQTLLLLIGTFYSFILLIRAARMGLKNGIKGFKTVTVAISIGAFSLAWVSAAVLLLDYGNSHMGFNELKYGISPDLIFLVFNAGNVVIPIGLSIFMGIQGSETNRAMIQQIIENEQLKIKSIEQEQEKQHILETQNETLEKQVAERTAELNNSLETLKTTQNQLIQSEKLASLGELTAGIAHEIQNPLNFVNNFSELSVDLIKEIQDERHKTPEQRDQALEEELLHDLAQNQQKINHHGRRAAAIVTGMLQHARTSTGKKEPTDLNALADEYLRLSYHGLRAKDSTFNAKMETDFDPTIGKIEVVPQDIGRMILNLLNNAFYAVQQRASASVGVTSSHADTMYQPTVTIITQNIDNQIIIKIKDNGTGIPDDVKARIFQPFFTTKPTGQGTGLGLSLAYDIVAKGHGGVLEVESKEGEGTEFLIKLNIANH